MALSITERWESGAGTLGRDSSDEYSVIVKGDPVTDNADDPATVMLFAVPNFSLISSLGNVVHNFGRERIAPGMWKVTAEYRHPAYDRQTNDASFSFTIGEGNQHITHSISTIKKYADKSGNAPPDFQGCIGVDQDGNIAGTDIDETTMDFRTTFYVPPANLTQAYVDSLKTLRGQVNSDTVTINVDSITYSFQPGELRYRHADGGKRVGFGDWEFTLNWSALPNLSNLTVGPITGIAKKGWEYLWVLYSQSPDTASNTRIPQPKAAYVEQVYTYAPLTPLLFQTSFGLTNNQGWAKPTPVNGTGVTSQ